MIRPLAIALLLSLSWSLQASPQSTTETRIEQIETARDEKEANLKPEAEPKLERNITSVEHGLPYKLLTSEFHGFGLRLGGIGPSAGIAVGPQYTRRDLLGGKLSFKAGASASIRRSYATGVSATYGGLLGGRAYLTFDAAHRNLSEVPYYGAGPDSEKSGRSDYRLEDTTLDFRPNVKLARHLLLGGDAAYIKVNIGPGHSTRYISTERQYAPETTPGINDTTKFWRGGGLLEYDWRDRDWSPTSGGKYSAQFSRYLDRDLGRFSFERLDFDAAQYIPLVNHTRVIALHGATSLTKTNGNQVVPFYLQPSLGGAETLRGYRLFRFTGHDSVMVNAEYRWEVSPSASLSAFADAGRVFDRWSQWNLHDAESDVGFGFAFRTESKVAFRIDTGFSHEGVQVWFRASNLF